MDYKDQFNDFLKSKTKEELDDKIARAKYLLKACFPYIERHYKESRFGESQLTLMGQIQEFLEDE